MYQNVSTLLDPAFCKCPVMISNPTPMHVAVSISEFCDRSHWWRSKKWRVPKCRPKLIGLVAPTRVWTCLNIPWNAAHPSGQGPALCFWSSHARRQGKRCLEPDLMACGLRDLWTHWRLGVSSHSKSIRQVCGPGWTGGKKLYVEIIGVPAYVAFSRICAAFIHNIDNT